MKNIENIFMRKLLISKKVRDQEIFTSQESQEAEV